MLKGKREAIESEDEIFGYLKQSHISNKNVSRLKTLAAGENAAGADGPSARN
jgi:hypothetical protein